MAWRALQGELRESMNMEEDRVLFDAIMAGRSRAEAVEIAMLQKENDEKAKQEDDDVDFF
jgi:iron-sulfur cluster repair protein YtfE (RIC family)